MALRPTLLNKKKGAKFIPTVNILFQEFASLIKKRLDEKTFWAKKTNHPT